jgi:hypothetical protein
MDSTLEEISEPRTRSAPVALSLARVRDTEAWDRLAPACDSLALEARAFYLSHAWLRSYWAAFGRGELDIRTAHRDGLLVAWIPWRRTRWVRWGLPLRQIENLFSPPVGRSDVAVGRQDSQVMDLVLEDSLRDSWELAVLLEIPAASPWLQCLIAACARVRLRVRTRPSLDSPFITIAGDWNSYLRHRPARHVKALRNRRNRLKAEGLAARFECVSRPEDVGHLMPEVYSLARRSWTGQRNRSIADEPQRTFFGAAIERFASAGKLRLWTLRFGDRLASFEIHVRWAGVETALKASFDPEFAPLSPGAVLDAHVIESLFDEGQVRRYDLLGKPEPYKLRWTDEVERHVEVFVFNGRPASRLIEALEFGLRPRLSRAKRLIRGAQASPGQSGGPS